MFTFLVGPRRRRHGEARQVEPPAPRAGGRGPQRAGPPGEGPEGQGKEGGLAARARGGAHQGRPLEAPARRGGLGSGLQREGEEGGGEVPGELQVEGGGGPRGGARRQRGPRRALRRPLRQRRAPGGRPGARGVPARPVPPGDAPEHRPEGAPRPTTARRAQRGASF